MRISQESTIPDQDRHQSQAVILLADDLVIQTENMLADEARWRLRDVAACVPCHIVHVLTSKGYPRPSGARRSCRYCKAACFFIQSSKSSCDNTERYAFML